jgi:2-(1,2-epoxy-1,2-dihydrophenyl)acetyl-CoA isomerase
VELALLNPSLNAKEAQALGLVNRVYPDDAFMDNVAAVARELAGGPALAFGDTKKLLQLGLFESLETQMEFERKGISKHALEKDFAEGISAFVGKRKPKFG